MSISTARTVRLPSLWWIALCLGLVACSGPEDTLAEYPDEELVGIFRELHERVYEVYGMPPDPDPLHGLLAASFAGGQLTREYVEHFTTLHHMEQDETFIQILQIDYDQVDVLDRGAGQVRIEAGWSVGGVVSHRSHQHPRINRYQAVYTLERCAAVRDPRYADDPEVVRTFAHDLCLTASRMKNLTRVRSDLASTEGLSIDQGDEAAGGRFDPSQLLRTGILDDFEEAEREREEAEGERDENEAGEQPQESQE